MADSPHFCSEAMLVRLGLSLHRYAACPIKGGCPTSAEERAPRFSLDRPRDPLTR